MHMLEHTDGNSCSLIVAGEAGAVDFTNYINYFWWVFMQVSSIASVVKVRLYDKNT